MKNEQLMMQALECITKCTTAHDARDIAHEALATIKWPDEKRIDVIASNGNDGDHYKITDTGARAKPNKYQREIKKGVFVDVYDVLKAWRVTNPALQHLIKKALQPGARGHKSYEQDLQDIIDSAIRAKDLDALK